NRVYDLDDDADEEEECPSHGLGDGKAGTSTLLSASEDKDLEPKDNENVQGVGLGITSRLGEELGTVTAPTVDQQNRSRFAWARSIVSRKTNSEGRLASRGSGPVLGQDVLSARQGYKKQT
ncbi:hypothetical protein C0995_006474, partial [Termitomyces sp. Mi166